MATSNLETNENQAKPDSLDTSDLLKTLLPYIIGIGSQLPLLFLYYTRSLDRRPHYGWWVFFALLVTVMLAWSRWPKDGRQQFAESLWSNILLAGGLVLGLGAILFIEPWFAAASTFVLIASMLARTIDRETGKSLWLVALPLFVSLQLPMQYDFKLIGWLQRGSANLTSRILDLIGIEHYMPGTKLKTPTGEYGIEEMCSGIQSFFLLVFVAVAFSVWMRRPLFRAIILFIAAIFWSVCMNCLRISIIPIFDIYFSVNLSEGIAHDLLGWATMLLGVLLLLSTDQFLMFLFGPVDVGTGSSGPMGKFITNVWNNLLAGEQEDEGARKRRRNRRPALTALSHTFAWIVGGILLVGGLWAMVDISNTLFSDKRIRFFASNVVFPLSEDSMPLTLDEWNRVNYDSDTRSRGSDLGEQSDSWVYQSAKSRFLAYASFDQAFPGWHELTTCYGNDGWELKRRDRRGGGDEVESNIPDEVNEWPYVEAYFEKPTGEKGYLLFSLFDGFGEGFVPPRTWGSLEHLMSGARNRLGEKTRARLFQSAGYQTQVFVQGYGTLTKQKRDEITRHYLKLRSQMKEEFLAMKNRELGIQPEDPAANASAAVN